MSWTPNNKRLPERLDAYDVTLLDALGSRTVNVALFRPSKVTWELMIDKHNYADCRVIAWKERGEPYKGRI